jgi:hypothetical protein
MWLLDRTVPPRRLERLNQRLTYLTGADKGGWSLTKVLRVPGSESTKYEDRFTVGPLVVDAEATYTVEDMTELLKDVEVTPGAAAIHMPQGDLPDRDATWKRRRRRIPVRARQLINAQTVLPSDDRSARMWELENLLLDAGLKPEEVLVLVRATIWNKYRGQRRELVRIWTEIAKAHANHTAKPKTKKRAPSSRAGLLPNSLSYDDFMNREWPKPSWLVEGWWTAGAYGILAGEYKAFKTMLLLNMALAVASGKPFLAKYPVTSPGMVNYIHEEGRQWSIHDRMARIAHWMDLTDKYDATSDEIVFQGRSLPIVITSMPKLNLLNEDDQQAVAKHVETTQPKLVILETFYLLAGGASESALEEVAPMLEFLAYLSHTYGCAVLLSHHFHKSSDDRRFLDRISGSNIFGRWYESLIAVERQGEETDNKIKLVASHRDGASTQTQITLNWTNDDDGSTFDLRHVEDDDPDEEVVEAVTKPKRGGFKPIRSTTSLGVPIELDLDGLPARATVRDVMVHQTEPFWAEDVARACGIQPREVLKHATALGLKKDRGAERTYTTRLGKQGTRSRDLILPD